MISAGQAVLSYVTAAFLLALPSTAQAQDDVRRSILGVHMLDQRVATLGHRLAVAGTPFCTERQWLPGLSVHDLSQYSGDLREAAAQTFGLARGPAVLALAAGGPAEQAGLRLNDIILEIDGVPLPQADEAAGSTAGIDQILERLEEGFADGSAEIAIRRDDGLRRLPVEAEEGCASRFHLLPSGKLNARADGRNVVVTTAIATYVQDDGELAAVLAHEFAHNILRHRARLDATLPAGASADERDPRHVRLTEAEADRLSVYLLDRAGFDPMSAVRFWQRFGPKRLRLLSGSSHPHWRQRVNILREEIASIRRQNGTGVIAMPAFLRAATIPK